MSVLQFSYVCYHKSGPEEHHIRFRKGGGISFKGRPDEDKEEATWCDWHGLFKIVPSVKAVFMWFYHDGQRIATTLTGAFVGDLPPSH